MEDVEIEYDDPQYNDYHDFISTFGGISTFEKADMFIEEALQGASIKEKENVVRTFFGITYRKYLATRLPRYTEEPEFNKNGVGGSVMELKVDTLDKHHILMYRLMELMDTCHDFFNLNEGATANDVQIYIQENKYILPNGMTANMLLDPYRLITFLASRNTLTFQTTDRENG